MGRERLSYQLIALTPHPPTARRAREAQHPWWALSCEVGRLHRLRCLKTSQRKEPQPQGLRAAEAGVPQVLSAWLVATAHSVSANWMLLRIQVLILPPVSTAYPASYLKPSPIAPLTPPSVRCVCTEGLFLSLHT